MKGHKIYIRRAKRGMGADFDLKLLRRAVTMSLRIENVDVPCEISVLITDDAGIREINREFRDKDTPTDVLSFPLQELPPGAFHADSAEIDPESGLLPLGDIVLSTERITAQAEEYGHSVNHEMAYLVIHSVLHLLGYDHMDEAEEKRRMREREEAIRAKVGEEA